MKTNKIVLGLLTGGFLLSACNVNELPSFNDNDAFVSFTTTSMSIDENVEDSLVLEVLCTSLNGISCKATISVVDSGANDAKNGVNFTYYTTSGSDEMSFDDKTISHKVIIKPIDNAIFTGDKSFVINLSVEGANIGSDKTCNIIVADDEHPLAFILGSFTASGESYFNGPTEWNITITKDADDLSKVWISNLVPDGTSLKVYGTVNDDKNEIRIPVLQEIASSSSYPHILLEGFYDAGLNEEIEGGGYITGKIAADGTITIENGFGSHVYTDAAATQSAGWYNIMLPPVVFTK